jgi:tetrahydromethanopterin S-methyltransferase subunit E
MTSGIIPPDLGGWFIDVIFGLIGFLSFWSTLHIPEEEEASK